MTAYWITRVNVTDEAEYGKYAKLAGPALAKYDGRFIARGGRTVTLEGTEYTRNVIVEFPSIEAAETCYNSPEYQEALTFAKDSSDRLVCVVEGV